MGEVTIFELETTKIISPERIDFELEWLGEGLRSYPPLEKIRKNYNADNKISQIVKLSGKPVVAVGDEIGTIRFYTYPNPGGDCGIYYQCQAEHLFNITQCMFTHDQKFFVSMSS